jgi:monoamine oxidase
MTAQRWDRRRFLRMASAGAMASTGFTASGLGASTAPSPQVLIIGAGMSGVAASFWLRQFGISSLILEGRNRLGGRIDTSYYWPDAPLDIGASWIHDSAHSPLTPLTKLFNIGTYLTDFFFKMYGLSHPRKVMSARRGICNVGKYAKHWLTP